MKKLLKGTITALLLAGLIFTGCDPNPTPENPSDNNGQQNTEQTDKPVTKPSQSDKDDKNDNSSTDKENKDETTDNKNDSVDKDQDKTPEDETNNEQDNSNPEETVKGAAVTNFTATKGDTTVTLNWTNPTTGTLSSVKIYTGTTSTPATLATTITDKSTSYVVTGLVNNTNYYFKAVTTFSDDQNEYSSNVISATPRDSSDLVNISSVDFAKELVIGWNLGNAFDANSVYDPDVQYSDYGYTSGVGLEYNWLPHKIPTSQDLIKAVKAAGFKTIRIPISWHNHMGKIGQIDFTNYTIDSTWMNRVKEVVDWAIAEDMYVIINIHHDNITETAMDNGNPGFVITETTEYQTKSKDYIKKTWEQIANTFKNYDNRLIFELLNEPRCIGTDWEWGFYGSNNNSTTIKKYCDIITAYEQVALDTIRSTGGNNATRFVMAPSYAAAPDYITTYKLPTDTAADKLILATHAYTPGDFCLDGDKSDYAANKSYIENAINEVFSNLSTNYISKGIGVVMGEASASDKNNLESRLKWVDYYFTKARIAGVPIMLWDNETAIGMGAEGPGGENHGYFNRDNCTQTWPEMIEAMMDAAYEDNTPAGGNDTPAPTTIELWSGSKDLKHWNGDDGISIASSNFSSATSTSSIRLTISLGAECSALNNDDGTPCSNNYSSIHPITAWTNGSINFTTNMGTVNTSKQLEVGSILSGTTEKTVTITPDSASWTTIKAKGLIFYGHKTIITKIELLN